MNSGNCLSYLMPAVSLEAVPAQPVGVSPYTCTDWSLAKNLRDSLCRFPELCPSNASPVRFPTSNFILLFSARLPGSVCMSPSLSCSLEITSNILKGNSRHVSGAPRLHSALLNFPATFSSPDSAQQDFLKHSLGNASRQKARTIRRQASLVCLLLGPQPCTPCCPKPIKCFLIYFL